MNTNSDYLFGNAELVGLIVSNDSRVDTYNKYASMKYHQPLKA